MQFFSKLHAFCSLRDIRNCTLSKWPRHALPNQVKLHPSNELATPLLHWQQLKRAAVRALALFTTRTVSLILSRRIAMRTEWKRGKSDEIMSHGSTSCGVLLALFMAATLLRGIAWAPLCYFFWTLGGYRSCNYFACCSCNYSQITLESMWLPIQMSRLIFGLAWVSLTLIVSTYEPHTIHDRVVTISDSLL